VRRFKRAGAPPIEPPEIVVNKGQFPDAETDYALFCEVTTSALGL